MKQLIKPTTIPYLIHFDGNYELKMYDKDGKIINVTPIGEWFCCRGKIEEVEYVVIFDNKVIIPINVIERNFLNYLFGHYINIRVSCFSYKLAFKDFNKNNVRYEFQV